MSLSVADFAKDQGPFLVHKVSWLTISCHGETGGERPHNNEVFADTLVNHRVGQGLRKT
jgi:hypothetical protein